MSLLPTSLPRPALPTRLTGLWSALPRSQCIAIPLSASALAWALVSAMMDAGWVWYAALPMGGVLGLCFGLLFLSAWLHPQWYSVERAGRMSLALGLFCGGFGMFWGLCRLGLPTGAALDPAHLLRAAREGLPLASILGLATLVSLLLMASERRERMARELTLARSQAQEEQAKREATEARLRLLQAQIQPHFIFNTLAAVQHWVDERDARASPLLRELGAFLRGSAELMLQSQVTLEQELGLVAHYLAVMKARWGDRLRYDFELDHDSASRATLPPGIVLSLVENALEHGISPLLRGGELLLQLRSVGATGWELRITDNGAGLREGWQEGLGLGNSRARLQGALGERATLHIEARPVGTLVRLSVADGATA